MRQKIGDTNVKVESKIEVQDETIQAYLNTLGGVSETAYQLALDLAAKYAKYGDVTVDDQLQRYKHIYDNYVALAERLGREIGKVAVPTAAAIARPGIMVSGVGDCRGPLDDCCNDYGYRGRC